MYEMILAMACHLTTLISTEPSETTAAGVKNRCTANNLRSSVFFSV